MANPTSDFNSDTDPYNWRESDDDELEGLEEHFESDKPGGSDSGGDEGEMPCGWQSIKASFFPVKVEFNSVDNDLLRTARATTPVIIERLKSAIGLGSAVSYQEITREHLFATFFNSDLLRQL